MPGSKTKLKVWGMKRVWFGYDSRSTIQHTVSDLDRSYNGQSAPEAGRCKRYQLPQWSYSGQSAQKLSSTYLSAHGSQTAGMEGGMVQMAPKGGMKLQRPVSTQAVFNLIGCIGQPDCGDGGRDGAKGA